MVKRGWRAYVAWLSAAAPRLVEFLAPSAAEAQIREYERVIEMRLPVELVDLWSINAGQLDVGEPGYAPFVGMEFLSPEASLREWREWQQIWDEEGAEGREDLSQFCRSVPEGAIKLAYVTRGWLPVFKEPLEPNYLGVDLNPEAAGTVGQIINFGRDDEEKVVIAWSLSELLDFVVADVTSGAFRVAPPPAGYTMPDIKRHRTGRYLSYLAHRAELEGPLS